MPLREEDRAVWAGDPAFLEPGSSGKVRQVHRRRVLVDWGDGHETWCAIDREVVTCRQAANRGLEPWATAFRRTKRQEKLPDEPEQPVQPGMAHVGEWGAIDPVGRYSPERVPYWPPEERDVIARILGEQRARATQSEGRVIAALARGLADYFKAQDPDFDRTRFYVLAGVTLDRPITGGPR